MIFPDDWGAWNWILPVAMLMLIALVVIVWSYLVAGGSLGLKIGLGLTKFLAIGLLVICLLEPMNRFKRPEPGANLMLVLADDSQSMQIKDRGVVATRASIVHRLLNEDSEWLQKLASEFDVRRYQFDRQLRPVTSYEKYSADQRGSDIISNLELAADRIDGRPAAGIVILTDGNSTDLVEIESQLKNWNAENMPPLYPIVIGNDLPAKDIGITRVSSTQSNFETAPVTITAELIAHGYAGNSVCVQLLDKNNRELEKQTIDRVEDGRTFAVRFNTKPTQRGVNVFHVRTFPKNVGSFPPADQPSEEATVVNNQRTVIVNRGRGPFRVLYVAGRPNWELKFLRRAMADDSEIEFVALVRIAKKEAKFTFRGRSDQQSNPLFRGFANQDDDTAEQHDEPVFLRVGTKDADELRDGFPQVAESLFAYDAVILDDVEAKFFTEEQKSLLQQFVSLRGGGLLMLGGQESFAAGDYDHTPIGEMMPIYLDDKPQRPADSYQLNLTREGWLQPWVRVESTEDKERQRLVSMPKFRTLNIAQSIKPGASVLATVKDENGTEHPALVVQPFGKGRTAALMIGDGWRWHLKSPVGNNDLMKSWRQTIRWLVADVPRRVEADAQRESDTNQGVEIFVDIRDERFKPLDNANVAITVATPDGKSIQLAGRASDAQAGRYSARFASTVPGAYRATVEADAADGSSIEQRETGWVADPDADEFQSLVPNRALLEKLAARSGGEVIEADRLDQFVNSMRHRKIPVTETRTLPWWHRWTVFSIALSLLVAEWGVRRWKGLP